MLHDILQLLRQLFTLDPTDPFKTGSKIVAMLVAAITILTTLITKTWPWVKAKLDSRSVSKRLGAELYTPASIEQSLRHYIRPWCQDVDPSGGEEPRLVVSVQQKLFEVVDRILSHPTEYNFIILLADSGMGKTSALLNYYVHYLRRLRKPFKLALIPLSIPDADEKIAGVPDKGETVLFLDALDEDTLAMVDYIERLRLILKATKDFQRVLITCRTQFFSKDEEIPKETGKLKIGARAAGEPAEYLFHKIYLSPFTDQQVQAYLKKRYPIWKWRSRKRAQNIAAKIPHLTARPMLLAHIDDLVRTKRTILYSFQLYEKMVEAWLIREQGFIPNKAGLREFSERLAVNLYLNRSVRGAERIPRQELAVLAKKWNIPLEEWSLGGRSLLNRDAVGNYKFAHRSIMEYLYVVRFLEGEQRCVNVEWTDQMKTFLWEILFQRRKNFLSSKAFRVGQDQTYSNALTKLIADTVLQGLNQHSERPLSHDSLFEFIVQCFLAMVTPYLIGDLRIMLYATWEPMLGTKLVKISDGIYPAVKDLPEPIWLNQEFPMPASFNEPLFKKQLISNKNFILEHLEVAEYPRIHFVEGRVLRDPFQLYIFKPNALSGHVCYMLRIQSDNRVKLEGFKHYSSTILNILDSLPNLPVRT